MDKYVGEAERNIRDVFKDAEMEWARFGEQVCMRTKTYATTNNSSQKYENIYPHSP